MSTRQVLLEVAEAENTQWDKTEAERFLKEHVKGFARYRELASGLEITPDQLS